MAGLDPKRANFVVGIVVVALVGAAGYVAYQTLHAQQRGTRANDDLEETIEKMRPKGGGVEPDPYRVRPHPLAMRLTPVEDRSGHIGKVRVDLADRTWSLDVPEAESQQQQDLIWAEVAAPIRAWHERYPDATGEIITPLTPKVPHPIVMRALDTFMSAGIEEVDFAPEVRPGDRPR